MILDVKSARASWAAGKFNVAFDVAPSDHDHLDLKTGEIFQRASYAALRKQEDKAISAVLYVSHVERSTDEAQFPREMRYWKGGAERDSQIAIFWHLPDDSAERFWSLLLAGRTPSQAVVSFPLGRIEFGWEPDGSGQNWDNEANPSIPIEDVSFSFDLGAPPANLPLNANILEADDRASFSDAASVNFALVRKLAAVESSIERISWTVGFIALLLLGFALSRFWH